MIEKGREGLSLVKIVLEICPRDSNLNKYVQQNTRCDYRLAIW